MRRTVRTRICRTGGTKGLGARAAAFAAAAALALIGGGPAAQAAVIAWTLQDVVFDDGGAASGVFDYDTTLGRADNFDITTTDGSVLGGFHYDPSTSLFFFPNLYAPISLLWLEDDSTRYVHLAFSGPLGTPGTQALTTSGGGYECDNCLHGRKVVGGSATGVAIPERASWALMLVGFLAAGAALRRSRQTVRVT